MPQMAPFTWFMSYLVISLLFTLILTSVAATSFSMKPLFPSPLSSNNISSWPLFMW